MTVPDLLRAAEILDGNAETLLSSCTVRGKWDPRDAESKREHDDCLRLEKVMRYEAGASEVLRRPWIKL